jgi:hypothetical protein
LAVLLLVRSGLVQQNSTMAQVMLGPGTIPALQAAGLLETPTPRDLEIQSGSRRDPPQTARGAGIVMDRQGTVPKYRQGDRMRIGFSVPAEFNVVLIEDRPNGDSVRLFPNRFQSSARVSPGTTILIPPAGQGDLSVDGDAGRYTLRLLLFPPDVNPLENEMNWSQLRGQARITEKRFEVQP